MWTEFDSASLTRLQPSKHAITSASNLSRHNFDEKSCSHKASQPSSYSSAGETPSKSSSTALLINSSQKTQRGGLQIVHSKRTCKCRYQAKRKYRPTTSYQRACLYPIPEIDEEESTSAQQQLLVDRDQCFRENSLRSPVTQFCKTSLRRRSSHPHTESLKCQLFQQESGANPCPISDTAKRTRPSLESTINVRGEPVNSMIRKFISSVMHHLVLIPKDNSTSRKHARLIKKMGRVAGKRVPLHHASRRNDNSTRVAAQPYDYQHD